MTKCTVEKVIEEASGKAHWLALPLSEQKYLPSVSFFIFSICPPLGLLTVLGPLERYRLLYLKRPCLVALGQVLIKVERRLFVNTVPMD